MATTVTNPYAVGYDYPIGGTVFCVNAVTGTYGIHGVNEAVVSGIQIHITQAGQTLTYNIAYKNATLGSASVPESQLYPDVDSALTAYRTLVLTY